MRRKGAVLGSGPFRVSLPVKSWNTQSSDALFVVYREGNL